MSNNHNPMKTLCRKLTDATLNGNIEWTKNVGSTGEIWFEFRKRYSRACVDLFSVEFVINYEKLRITGNGFDIACRMVDVEGISELFSAVTEVESSKVKAFLTQLCYEVFVKEFQNDE